MAATTSEIELDVTGIAHGGVSVARVDGRVVFVADAIPGERVLVRIADTRHDSFWRADTVRVIEPSPHRREHVWPEAAVNIDPADRAGGAEFGHIDLVWQRELKRQVLADAFSRFARLEPEIVVEPAPSDVDGPGTRWRTRVTLHVDREGRVGPYAARSRRVVPVAELPLATQEVEDAARVTALRPQTDRLEVVSDDGGVHAFAFRRKRSATTGGSARHIVSERVFFHNQLGFWQVHRDAPEVLTRAVINAVDEARFDPQATHLDLYGGVGLFAGALADHFGSDIPVITVESDAAATTYAHSNLADLPRMRAVTASVDPFVRSLEEDREQVTGTAAPLGVVVLDPPRKGAGRSVVESLARSKPAQIVYVACDPVALARDVGLFAQVGYRMDSVRAFDLFPHTHHIESVASLVPED